MDVWIYIVNSVVWSAGGFFGGYLLGRTRVEVHEIKEDHDDQS